MGYIGNSNPSVTNLGGDIDVNGHQIKSSSNGNIEIVPDGSGTVKIDVLTFPVADGSNGQFLQTNGSGVLSFSTPSGGIASVVADSTPQLGGNLDVNGNDIVSTSNGNIEILPNGSGKVHLDGNGSSGGVLVSDGLIEIKTGTGSVGEVRFYCESSNAHYVSLKSPAHSSYSGNVVLTLPATDGSSGEYLKTDGNGVLSWDTPSGGSSGMPTSGGTFTGAVTFNNSATVHVDSMFTFDGDNNYGIDFQLRGNNYDLVWYSAGNVLKADDNTRIRWGSGNDFDIYHDGSQTNFHIEQGTNPIVFSNNSNSELLKIQSTGAITMAGAFTFPTSDGSANQVLQTNGSGAISWATVSGGGGGASELDDLSDCFHDGFGCISIGYQAMSAANDDGTDEASSNHNIAFGYRALQNHTGGSSYDQIAIGQNALKSKVNSGQGNVCVGKETGPTLVGGYINLFMGYYAGYGASSAGYNIGLGYGALQNLTSGVNNIAIGKHAGKSNSPSGAISSGSNSICLGNNSIANLYCADTTISSSDARDKTDISDFSPGLSFIKKLRPVTYRWDKRSWYIEDNSDDVISQKPDGTYKKAKQHAGFLAQEVLAIEKEFGWAKGKDDMLFVNLNEDESAYGLKYERLIPVLVNAVKELSSEIDTLKTKVG